jgi:hypothetical protein
MGKIAFLGILMPLSLMVMSGETTAQMIINAPKKPSVVIDGIRLSPQFSARFKPARHELCLRMLANGCFVGRQPLPSCLTS